VGTARTWPGVSARICIPADPGSDLNNIPPPLTAFTPVTPLSAGGTHKVWDVGLSFPLSVLPAIWLSAFYSNMFRQATAILYATMAATWLLLGSTPLLLFAFRGRERMALFRKRVEYHCRSSFNSFLPVWILAIGVMVAVALRDLLT